MNPLQNKEIKTSGAVYKPAQPVQPLNYYDILMQPQTNFPDAQNPMFTPPNPMYQQVPFMNYMNLWSAGNYYSNYFGQPLLNTKVLFPQGDIKNSFPFTSFNQQTLRVNSQEKRDKGSPEVIDLESDEEKEKNGNSIVPEKIANNNSILKEIEIIDLDDNSEKEEENKPVAKNGPLSNEGLKKIEFAPHMKLRDCLEIYWKSSKERKSQIMESINQFKEYKAKEKKESEILKINRLERSKLKKKEKEKLKEEFKKSKEERVKLKIKLKQEKLEKAEKIRIMKEASIMRRIEEPTMKEIERYNESHGEIRLGCEFQSYVPNISTPTECNKLLIENSMFGCLKRKNRFE